VSKVFDWAKKSLGLSKKVFPSLLYFSYIATCRFIRLIVLLDYEF